MSFQVFVRNWWKLNDEYPDGREPSPGHSYPIEIMATEEEARAMCAEWNATHTPGKLSRKAEFTEI